MYKIRNGLKNFLYLGYLLLMIIVGLGSWKLYRWVLKLYYRQKLSTMPRNNLREMDEYRSVQKILESF